MSAHRIGFKRIFVMFQTLSSQLEGLNSQLQELSKELSLTKSDRDNFQAQITELQLRIGDNQKNMESEAIQRYNELLSKFPVQ